MVRDQDHGDALFTVEPLDGIEHLAAALRVKHGSRLVEHDALRLHGQHACDGHTLLLSAGEQLRRIGPVFVHADGAERIVDAPADLLRRDAEVFGREGYILLDHVRDDLVVGVLKDHADVLPDGEQLFLVLRVHAVDVHAAAGGQQDGVEVLGQRGFAAAVVAEDGHEAPLPDRQVQPVKDDMCFSAVLRVVGVAQAADFDRCGHGLSFVQRQVAPHGSTSPVSRTGSPSSSDCVLPPYFFATSISVRYRITDGARPVV